MKKRIVVVIILVCLVALLAAQSVEAKRGGCGRYGTWESCKKLPTPTPTAVVTEAPTLPPNPCGLCRPGVRCAQVCRTDVP